jgi:hypothetical protein
MGNENMKDYINQTLKNSKGKAYLVFLKNETLVSMLNEKYPHTDDFKIKIHLYLYDLDDYPMCAYSNCSNPVQFINRKFTKFCSKSCSAGYNKEHDLYKERNKKSIQTNLERYGVENYTQSPECSQKIKKTNIEKYGVEYYSQTDGYKQKIKQTNLEKYGSESYFQSENFIDKSKKTKLDRFGAEHHMHSDEIKNKIKKTNIEKYGVEHYFQTEEFKDKLKNFTLEKYGVEHYYQSEDFKEKSKQTIYERYGVKNYAKSDHFNEKMKRSNIDKYGVENYTKIHYNEDYMHILNDCNLFENMLNDIGIYKLAEFINCDPSTIYKYISTYNLFLPPRTSSCQEEIIQNFLTENNIPFISNTRRIIPSGKELDFYFPEHNLAIEINGIYWHSELSGGKDRKYHYNKWKECNDLGITLLSIQEDEFQENPQFWFNKILYMTGNMKPTKIHARKCEIRELVNVTDFLNEHHLQGSCASSYKFGLFYNNELVSVMTFSNTRNNDIDIAELSRFCNHSDYLVSGGASKLLSYFIKKYGHKYTQIISFSDNNYSNGNVYKSLGFSLHDNLKPDYKYVTNGKCYHKSGFRKSSIFKKFDIPDDMKDKSEWELMQYLGYDRIWDTGKKKWEMKI